jgi:hypothetical protein
MHHRSRGRRIAAVATIALSLASASPTVAAGPTLKADYRFQVSFDSSVAGGRHLDPLPVSSTVFASQQVLGRTVPAHLFAQGDGLDLAAASAVIPPRQYSIVVLMLFDAVDGYRRIIDFSNQSDDTGLYVVSGLLDMYDYDAPPSEVATIAPDTYVQVVLTRSRSGRLKGYVNGVRQFSYDDAVSKLGVITADDHLTFFRDTNAAEMSGGSVARIRLYNGPLTDSQVAHLSTVAPAQSVATSRSSVARSSHVTVSGRNFTPHEFVYVSLKDAKGRLFSLATAKATATGAFSMVETVPAHAHLGAGSIVALGQLSGLHAKVLISID